jgi:hypothetical protein
MLDILTRLRTDAGQLTIAALIQEREAAAVEIERLRKQLDTSFARRSLPPSQNAAHTQAEIHGRPRLRGPAEDARTDTIARVGVSDVVQRNALEMGASNAGSLPLLQI